MALPFANEDGETRGMCAQCLPGMKTRRAEGGSRTREMASQEWELECFKCSCSLAKKPLLCEAFFFFW